MRCREYEAVMSFICGVCHTPTAPRVPCTLRVVETRQVEYTNVHVADRYDPDDKDEVRVTKGFEIVREIKECPDCSKALNR